MPSKKSLLIALCASTAIGLMACGGGGDSSTPTPPPVVDDPPPPPVAQTPQQQAGSGFAFAFNQGRFANPINPTRTDIIPLDKTAEPIPIP